MTHWVLVPNVVMDFNGNPLVAPTNVVVMSCTFLHSVSEVSKLIRGRQNSNAGGTNLLTVFDLLVLKGEWVDECRYHYYRGVCGGYIGMIIGIHFLNPTPYYRDPLPQSPSSSSESNLGLPTL